MAVRALFDLPIDNYGIFIYKEKPVIITRSADREIRRWDISPHEIIDMLDDQNRIDCPKQRKQDPKDEEVCCEKNEMIFRIILACNYHDDAQETCWFVKHVKPVKKR